MLRKRRSRRIVAIFLVVLGGVLMYLAPEMWAGLAVLVLGGLVELAGIRLERTSQSRD
jgi:apolipoprotein N-acyltransferase